MARSRVVDFRAELQALVDQIPAGRFAGCGDLARALGDARAASAVCRVLRTGGFAGADRVVTADGRPVLEVGRTTAKPSVSFTGFRSDAPLARLRNEQRALAAQVSRRNGFQKVRTVGGVDIAYGDGRGFASLVVVDARDGSIEAEVLASLDVDFPYIPTYLAYRELPLIEAAFHRLSEPPTILLVDGHGQLHPARCGVACMAGIRLDEPTIGVAKSPLVGTADRRPKVGEAVPVRYDGAILGYAMRTGASLRPLFVSTGHRVAPRTAVRIVRTLCRTRLPEPLRLADGHAKDWKRRTKEKSKSRF
ncbi:MAG TPA: endonuclease V [Thermoplasmata archaeon]|nr:endonuclease V [Thermoplasmata archaeon]